MLNMVRPTDLIIGIALFFICFLLVYLDRYTRLESPLAIISSLDVLYLEQGGSVLDLTEKLSELDFQFNKTELLWAANIKGLSTYRAGRYEMQPNWSYTDFLSKLARGEQDPFMVRIPGGQTKVQLANRVAAQLRFEAQELMVAMNDSLLLREIGIERHLLIGRILPNSYEMFWTTTPEQFLRRLLREFDRAVTDRYTERALELGISIDEITTLASIIEWEVLHVEEKSRVSGLYWNRLNRRMRLQADPTVAYAVGERRRLLFSDYRVDHPYNTYRIMGLPPGPINNPRITSIRAALYPEQHNFLFMVATPEGYHTFTTSYDDHLRESRRWTTWLREQRQIREAREREATLQQTTSGK
jgi:UPF0755 protein